MPVSQATESSFSESVRALVEGLDYRAARSEAEKERIYRLRYAAYLREGALPPNAPLLFKDRYDDSANGVTIGVYAQDRLASSMRFHILDAERRDGPAMQVFADVLTPLLDRGATLVDPTRFVADSVVMRMYPKLPYATVRLAYLACEYFNADYGLATVRSEHQAFYRRIFGHQLICPARPYPSLAKPISLMMVDFSRLREIVSERYNFMESTSEDRERLFQGVTVRD